jgi:hypothetical protein
MSKRVGTEEWERLAGEALSGMAGWRAAHPKATLAEIEAETDRRLAKLRADDSRHGPSERLGRDGG